MNIVHIILIESFKNFLDNQPISRLAKNFKNGELFDNLVHLDDKRTSFHQEGSLLILNSEGNFYKSGDDGFTGKLRFYRKDVIPNILSTMLKDIDLDATLNVEFKGVTYEVEVVYDKSFGWFTCSSSLFDDLIGFASERSKE